jgi:site-specific DNA recombinase
VLAQDRDRFAREPGLRWWLEQELAEHDTRLRALNDRGDDSPEGELTDGMLDQLAKYERAKTAQRTRRARLQRARQGNVIAGNAPPFGYDFNEDRTSLIVDQPKMVVVRRVFDMVGAEGMSLNAARRTLEADHVPTARGGHTWQRVVLRDMIMSDLYKPHTYGELEALADEGLLSPAVLSGFDPGRSYGVWWYNRLSDRRTPDKRRIKTTEKPRSEWIAVPVEGSGVPREWVDAARNRIKANVAAQSSAGERTWELYGISFCACGWRLATYTNRRKNGTVRHFYVCSRRRHDNRECEHARYHQVGELEGRVRRFVKDLLENPAVVKEQIRLHAERERQRLREPEDQIKALLTLKERLAVRRERYLEQHAEGLRPLEDVKEKLADLDKQEAAVQRDLDRFRESERYLEDLDRLAEELVRDLSHLLDRTLPLREYETIGAERTPKNPLGVYTLTPERIREREAEELEEVRQAVEEERSARYRSVYDDLRLSLTAHKDGTLDIRWVGGESALEPQALQERSVSQGT